MRRAIPAALALLLVGSGAEPPGGEAPAADPAVAALYAPHRDARGRFFNPWEPMQRSFWRGLRWWLSPNPHDKSREPRVPRLDNDGAYLADPDRPASLTWVGHATFAIHDAGSVALTDPHFTRRAVFPARLHPPGIPIESIPAGALAVISHSHYDHLDEESVRALPDDVHWLVPLGLAPLLRDWKRERVTELDWWQSARHGAWTVTCLPSQHWSLRLGMDTNESLWCAWLLDSGERRYLFAGDTGYFAGFAEFGRRFAPIDVALLPIGAYEPRWFMRYQHMNPGEAFRAWCDLRARSMLGMHWGTFDLTDEPLDLPPRVLADIVAARGADPARVTTLAIGERWRPPPARHDDPAALTPAACLD